jgi:hypothetical protein
MKPTSADLSTLWEGILVRFEQQCKQVPRRWRLFYRLVRWAFVNEILG